MYSVKTPITLDYMMLVALGLFVSLGTLLWAILSFPNYALISIVLVPPIITPVYCLYASLFTKDKQTVSPVYLMILNVFVSLILTGVMYHNSSGISLTALLFAVITVYFLWIPLSLIFQAGVRFLLGAYGTVESIEKNLVSYEVSKRAEDVVFQIVNKRWLALLCGLKIEENKSGKGKIRLRLRKFRTNLYLAVYGESTDDEKTVLNVTPYAVMENFRVKKILSNEEIKNFLTPQMEQIEDKLNMARVDVSSTSHAFRIPETIEYTLYPARFPVETISGHKTESGVLLTAGFLVMILTTFREAALISDTIFVGFVGIVISIATAATLYLLRR